MPEENVSIGYADTSPTRRAESELIQLVVFMLEDEEFGVNIGQIREIIRKGPITLLPDSPDFIGGVINVRGEIVVVIDLKARFNLQRRAPRESKHIIITQQGKTIFGLMVDEVSEVLRVPKQDIRPTPELVARIEKKYISGILNREGRLIVLMDLKSVLMEEDLVELAEVVRKHPRYAEEPTARDEKTKDEAPSYAKASEGKRGATRSDSSETRREDEKQAAKKTTAKKTAVKEPAPKARRKS